MQARCSRPKEATVNTEPRWSVPAPYGYAAAIESMGAIAAPLLAGVSAALAMLVLQRENAFEWPSLTLCALVLAVLAFIAAVQFTFRARQFAVTPLEIEMWWPDADDPQRREQLRRAQRHYRRRFEVWSDLASGAYDLGLLAFLLGVALSIVPDGGLSDASAGRVAAFVVAAAGFAAEFIWVAVMSIPRSGDVKNWPPPPGPELRG
jgi:hypothetical protein